MQNNIFYVLRFFIVLAFTVMIGCGKTDDSNALVSADISIDGVDTFIRQMPNEGVAPIVFPRLLPRDTEHKKYYLSSEALIHGENRGYIINVGYTPDCNGARFCMVGYLSAEKGAKLEMAQDMDGKVITVPVKLANNVEGYYTPGHAMGSYFPPTLQWYEGDVLYILSWDEKLADKNTLIMMANSTSSYGKN
ncbi:MAG: hypothetical protein K0Q74_911 [Gammaproteobacteria bacterium]|jgi:hypothetical protein|nr:hypothetical protein [Gammaproteobacteria bacterium]